MPIIDKKYAVNPTQVATESAATAKEYAEQAQSSAQAAGTYAREAGAALNAAQGYVSQVQEAYQQALTAEEGAITAYENAVKAEAATEGFAEEARQARDEVIGKTASYDAHVADNGIHVTEQQKEAWDGKQDAIEAGTGIVITAGEVSVDDTLSAVSSIGYAESSVSIAGTTLANASSIQYIAIAPYWTKMMAVHGAIAELSLHIHPTYSGPEDAYLQVADNEAFSGAVVSKNTQTHLRGTTVVYTFDGCQVPYGKWLYIRAVTEDGNVAQMNLHLFTGRNTGDDTHVVAMNGSTYNWIPEIEVNLVSQYSSSLGAYVSALDERLSAVESVQSVPSPEPLAINARATWDITPDMPYIALYYQAADAEGNLILNFAFGGADTPEELASELNKEPGMSSLFVFSSEGNTLIATAVATGAAGNGMKFGFISTQPPYPECLMELAGGGLVPGPLKHSHIYTATVVDGLDISGLTMEEYGTCEVWIDYVSGSVSWPTGLWWVEGGAPMLEAGHSYIIVLRNDGRKLRANVQYKDETPVQA